MFFILVLFFSLQAYAEDACVARLGSKNVSTDKLAWLNSMFLLNIDILERYDSVVELGSEPLEGVIECLDSQSCLQASDIESLSCDLYLGRVDQVSDRLEFEIAHVKSDMSMKIRQFSIKDQRSVVFDELEHQLQHLIPKRSKKQKTVSVSSLSKVRAAHNSGDESDLIFWTESPGDPVQIAGWGTIPKVVVCMRSMFSEARVKDAFAYWERLGYHFDSVVYNSLREECQNGDFPLGVIMITDDISPVQDYYLARTFMQISEKKITSARIEMKPEARQKDYLLEHEIGHALGWNHATRVGHLMCAEYGQMTKSVSPMVQNIDVQQEW